MLPIYLTWTFRDIFEVGVTIVLIVVLMGVFAAIPFIAEYYVDDRRGGAKAAVTTPSSDEPSD